MFKRTSSQSPTVIRILLACLAMLTFGPIHADALLQNITATDNADINVHIYPAEGNTLYIWQAHESGIQEFDHRLAKELTKQGIEVWIPELLEAYFLPTTQSSMDRVPAQAYLNLLNAAVETGKFVVIGASGRGAIPVLRGIREWQLQHPNNIHVLGTVLISPKLFVETPDPGIAGKLMPIVEASNTRIVILQPEKSPWFWKLDQSVAGLQKGGSDITVWRLAKVRDRFYFRPDANDDENNIGQNLAGLIHKTFKLFPTAALQPRSAVAKIAVEKSVREGKKDRQLAPFRGDPMPPPLKLATLDGKTVNLSDLRNKVVLINFWASWCPPCVHEMPSMQQLQNHFNSQPFVILGVNMAEDEQTIQNFLHTRVKIEFPILLDKDGAALQNWKVFAFPTTYVVDKHGRIRYALFGGTEWDTPEIKQKIRSLIDEK